MKTHTIRSHVVGCGSRKTDASNTIHISLVRTPAAVRHTQRASVFSQRCFMALNNYAKNLIVAARAQAESGLTEVRSRAWIQQILRDNLLANSTRTFQAKRRGILIPIIQRRQAAKLMQHTPPWIVPPLHSTIPTSGCRHIKSEWQRFDLLMYGRSSISTINMPSRS